MPSFFRPEVVEGQRQAWLGSIQLIRPVSFALLTTLMACVAVLVFAYFYWGQYTHRARVTGFLVPDLGVIRLVSPQAATVLERHAVEGQAVRQGEVLFVLSLERPTLAGGTQAAVQASLLTRERSLQATREQKDQLLQSQQQALELQLSTMRRELSHMTAEARLHRQRLTLARQAQARLDSLRGENFVSAAQVQTKAEEVLALRAQLQALERQQAAHEREIGQLEAEQRELPLQAQAQQGEIERDLASIAQASAESEALRRVVVLAPQDGMLTSVLAAPGQVVSPELALASLVPKGARLQAHLFAPSSAMGFVHAEQAVLMRYQPYPYQKFGHQSGRVLQVARTPLPPAELAGLAVAKSDEPLYRITVALDRQDVMAYGRSQSLSPGMQLEADVLLDRRRLIEWIFEPLLSVTGRV